MIKVNIELSWSKLIALLIIILAFILELLDKSSGVFFAALPTAAGLILGKQYYDKNKPKNQTS